LEIFPQLAAVLEVEMEALAVTAALVVAEAIQPLVVLVLRVKVTLVVLARLAPMKGRAVVVRVVQVLMLLVVCCPVVLVAQV
jgi:hypothetical protein